MKWLLHFFSSKMMLYIILSELNVFFGLSNLLDLPTKAGCDTMSLLIMFGGGVSYTYVCANDDNCLVPVTTVTVMLIKLIFFQGNEEGATAAGLESLEQGHLLPPQMRRKQILCFDPSLMPICKLKLMFDNKSSIFVETTNVYNWSTKKTYLGHLHPQYSSASSGCSSLPSGNL